MKIQRIIQQSDGLTVKVVSEFFRSINQVDFSIGNYALVRAPGEKDWTLFDGKTLNMPPTRFHPIFKVDVAVLVLKQELRKLYLKINQELVDYCEQNQPLTESEPFRLRD